MQLQHRFNRLKHFIKDYDLNSLVERFNSVEDSVVSIYYRKINFKPREFYI